VSSLLRETCVRPLAIEFESKHFTSEQRDKIRDLLESYGYQVYDANATPDAVHFADQAALNAKNVTLEMAAFRVPSSDS
jgi:ribose 5-phosphate isomerase RpiB